MECECWALLPIEIRVIIWAYSGRAPVGLDREMRHALWTTHLLLYLTHMDNDARTVLRALKLATGRGDVGAVVSIYAQHGMMADVLWRDTSLFATRTHSWDALSFIMGRVHCAPKSLAIFHDRMLDGCIQKRDEEALHVLCERHGITPDWSSGVVSFPLFKAVESGLSATLRVWGATFAGLRKKGFESAACANLYSGAAALSGDPETCRCLLPPPRHSGARAEFAERAACAGHFHLIVPEFCTDARGHPPAVTPDMIMGMAVHSAADYNDEIDRVVHYLGAPEHGYGPLLVRAIFALLVADRVDLAEYYVTWVPDMARSIDNATWRASHTALSDDAWAFLVEHGDVDEHYRTQIPHVRP